MTAIANEISAPATAPMTRRRHWLPVLLLTLLAAGLRFHCLHRPDLWYDEAATYHRVTSTYPDMLEILRTDGFVPLHYELYWVLARKLTLLPWQMRLVPAIAGTLMVPAIYLLARELVSRRGALLAAGMAACSAWFMAFSHDAKMYMHFWLFVTLHVAGLFAWMRTGRRLPFWCAVAAGCAMAGLHATGFFILALDLLFFLVHPRTTWRKGVAFTLMMALVVAGPVGYYLKFNRFAQTATSNWNLSGIQWIQWRNDGHSMPSVLADTASAYLAAFSFIPEPMLTGNMPDESPRWAVRAAAGFLAAILAFAALGTLPWPKRNELTNDRLPGAFSLFYLTAWIVIPAYVLYCMSIPGFRPPLAMIGRWGWTGVSLAAVVMLIWRPRTWRVVVPTAAVVLLCLGVYLAMRGRTAPGSVWMPRYLGFIVPAVLVALAALLVRLPRPLFFTAATLFFAVNLTQSLARLWVPNEPPISLMADDVWADRDPAGTGRTYVQTRPGFGPPGSGTITNNVGLYYLRVLSQVPVAPREFRFTSADRILPIKRYYDPAIVAWDVEASPNLREVTVWIETDDDPTAGDRLLARLGPGWHVASVADYPVRVSWTWAHMYDLRRIEFRKT